MNVLSLFDGMSCGQLALNRLGIKVDNYFASEIDKYAIQVTKANYPNTKHIGSVVDVKAADLPKIHLLIGGSPCQSFSFAGKRKGMSTKCNQEILTLEHYLQLKTDGFEFEGQSYLFWEYMRLLKETKPKYFLLENVMMGDKWQKVLSKTIGIDPIMINSSLLSAQNRKRLYWTNIGTNKNNLFGIEQPGIKQPKDKGILLKDVLESDVEQKYFLSDNAIKTVARSKHGKQCLNLNKKSICLVAVYYKQGRDKQYINTQKILGAGCRMDDNYINTSLLKSKNINSIPKNTKNYLEVKRKVKVRKNKVDIKALQKLLKKHKKSTYKKISEDLNVNLTIVEHWFRTDKYFSIPDPDIWLKLKEYLNIDINDFDNSIMEFIEKDGNFDQSNRVYTTANKSPCLTSAKKDNCIFVPENTKKGFAEIEDGQCFDATQPNYKTRRGSKMDKKTNCLTTTTPEFYLYKNAKIRRLTPIECERLQTVPDNYTNHVSDSQRYKMLGNGWTIDVIAYILKHMNL
tara:strand:+ start:289 stop:1830 length:1542 start_codon:yes stop_codon:yes gene_type:complete